MHTHRLIGATLLGLVMSLSAAAQGPSAYDLADTDSQADQAGYEPTPADAPGPAYGPGPSYGGGPVYAPGQYAPPAHDSHDGGHRGGHYAGDYGHCGCEGCGHDCGCHDCCDCCCVPCCRCPRITARVSGVYLKREEPDSSPLVTDLAGNTLFDAQQFDFEEEPGVDGIVMYQLNPCWGVEGRYLWIEDWEASAPVVIPALAQIGTNPPTPQFDTVSLFYTSELRTAELSLRRNVVRGANLTAGFRYVEFDESLRAELATAGVPATALFNTTNRLYGFQLGADALLIRHCRRVRVDGFVKAGIYWNDAEVDVAAVGPALANPAFGSNSDERASFLCEAGVFAGYQVTRHVAVRVGYQVMFLDEVVTASSQVSSTGLLTQPLGTPIPTLVHPGDGVFIHGYSAGLEGRY